MKKGSQESCYTDNEAVKNRGRKNASEIDRTKSIFTDHRHAGDFICGINEGVFRGISRPTADIYAFNINGYRPVIDDLTFGYSGAAPVPEPATILLLGMGCVVLGGYHRRKLKK